MKHISREITEQSKHIAQTLSKNLLRRTALLVPAARWRMCVQSCSIYKTHAITYNQKDSFTTLGKYTDINIWILKGINMLYASMYHKHKSMKLLKYY